jgi:hypothetical protein
LSYRVGSSDAAVAPDFCGAISKMGDGENFRKKLNVRQNRYAYVAAIL